MGIVTESFFSQESIKRIFRDMPIIYLSMIGVSISQYMLDKSKEIFDFLVIFEIVLVNTIVIWGIFFLFVLIHFMIKNQ